MCADVRWAAGRYRLAQQQKAVEEMSKPTVVVTRQLPQAAIAPILERCNARYWDSEEPIERSRLLEWVQGADGLYCLLTESVDDELLDAAGPGLRVVATMSVGYDHVDVAALRKRGIPLGNTPGVLTATTAETGAGLAAGHGAAAAGGYARRAERDVAHLATDVDDGPRHTRKHGGAGRPGADWRRVRAYARRFRLPHNLYRAQGKAGGGAGRWARLLCRWTHCWERVISWRSTARSTTRLAPCSASRPFAR